MLGTTKWRQSPSPVSHRSSNSIEVCKKCRKSLADSHLSCCSLRVDFRSFEITLPLMAHAHQRTSPGALLNAADFNAELPESVNLRRHSACQFRHARR